MSNSGIAWLKAHPEARKEHRRKYYAKTQGAPRTRKPWTPDEDARVLAHDIVDNDLASDIGRSVGAIQLRRFHLKSAQRLTDLDNETRA